MKSVLALLFSFTLFAQNPYPDTLLLKDGRSFPCIVMEINHSKVDVVYSKDIYRSTVLDAVQRISVENLGTVYLSDFVIDLDSIENFIEKRLERINIAKLENEGRIDSLLNLYQSGYSEERILRKNNKVKNRWSFGVLYIPYYSGLIYTLFNSSYPYYQTEVYATINNEANMEAQLTYALEDEFRITFDVCYTSTYYERKYESHTRDNGGYQNDNGTLDKNDLTLFDFNLGFKYYFKNILAENVSFFALAGIGKQFACAEEEYKSLFQDPPQNNLEEDNRNEFIEDSNSPFHLNFGFGAEYFFNESLSIMSSIRFVYSKIDAKYDSRTITDYQTNTNSIDYKKSDFVTRVGLGLNFYF